MCKNPAPGALWATRILISDVLEYHCCYMMVSCSRFWSRNDFFVRLCDGWRNSSSGLSSTLLRLLLPTLSRARSNEKKPLRVKVRRTRKLIAFLRSSSQLVTPQATNMHAHTQPGDSPLASRRGLMMLNNDSKWQGNNYNASKASIRLPLLLLSILI